MRDDIEGISPKYERNVKGSITKETIYENNSEGKVLSSTAYVDIDAYGNVRREVTAFGGKEYTRTFEYSSLYAHAFLTKETRFVTDLANQQKQINVQATYYPDTGNLASITDGKGYLTGYRYDKLNRLTTITNPDNSTTYTYIDEKNRIETKGEIGNITFEEWNPAGWKVKEAIKLAGREIKNTEYFSDAPRIKEFTYNNANQVLTDKDSKGLITTSDYDVLGNLVTVTMPNSEVTLYEYDFLGNVTKVIYPDNTFWG